jgi:hypothetical protein
MADFYRLLDKREPIYVTNHTGGKIVMVLRREGSKTKPFTALIPPIKDYPMNLGKIVPYPIIEFDHSTVFEWLTSGLKLWSPSKVKELYEEDPDLEDAVEEMLLGANQRRKFESKDIGLSTGSGSKERAKDFTGKRNFDELGEVAVSIGANAPMKVSTEGGAVTLQLAAEQQKVHPSVAELVAVLQEDESLSSETLIKLRTMDRDLLTKEALGFVIDNCGKFSNISKWARGELAKLTSKGEESKTKKGKKSKK